MFLTVLSDPIILDPPSPTHNSSNIDDVPLRKVYSSLEKTLSPTPSTKPQPRTDDDVKESAPSLVKPLQAIHPDGDSIVCPPYLDVDTRIEELTKRKDEVLSRIAQARASQTSSSSFPPKPELEKAFETVPETTVLENQQQPETKLQMASEICTTLIIHHDFKPYSPLESHFETTSSEQV